MTFDIPAIFGLWAQDVYYRKSDKTVHICSRDNILLQFLAKKYGGKIHKKNNYKTLVLCGDKAKKFVDLFSF